MDIFQWDEQDFSLEIDIKNCIGIGAWVKSRQLPYSNVEKFGPIIICALVSDHLP